MKRNTTAAVLVSCVMIAMAGLSAQADVIPILSGLGWKCTTSSSVPLSWATAGFDDSSWSDSTVVTNPNPPNYWIPGTTASHMWCGSPQPNQTVYFRKSFALPYTNTKPCRAICKIAVDDEYDLYVNGWLVKSRHGLFSTTPESHEEVDITQNLKPDGETNIIAIRAKNYPSEAFVVFDLQIEIGPSLIAPAENDVVPKNNVVFTWASPNPQTETWLRCGFVRNNQNIFSVNVTGTSSYARNMSGVASGTTLYAQLYVKCPFSYGYKWVGGPVRAFRVQ